MLGPIILLRQILNYKNFHIIFNLLITEIESNWDCDCILNCNFEYIFSFKGIVYYEMLFYAEVN